MIYLLKFQNNKQTVCFSFFFFEKPHTKSNLNPTSPFSAIASQKKKNKAVEPEPCALPDSVAAEKLRRGDLTAEGDGTPASGSRSGRRRIHWGYAPAARRRRGQRRRARPAVFFVGGGPGAGDEGSELLHRPQHRELHHSHRQQTVNSNPKKGSIKETKNLKRYSTKNAARLRVRRG